MNALSMQRDLDEFSVSSLSVKNENKTDFWKVFSHDLRGSMVSTGAALKLIDQGVYGKMDSDVHLEIRKVLDRIRGSIFSLEEFLGMVMSEENKAGGNIPKKTLNMIKDIIQPVLKEINNEYGESEQHIYTMTDSILENDAWFQGNQFLLKSALKNLLQNAIKYGDNGCSIFVGLKKRGPFLKVNVSNNGNTISHDDQDLLFTKFSNVSNASVKKDGLGIGLYIVKDIVQSHGGDIWYEELPEGKGSNFIFTVLSAPKLNIYDIRDYSTIVHSMNPSLSLTFQLENAV